MSTKQILIWSAVAIGGYLVYKKLTAPNNKAANPITTATQGRGNSAGTPAHNGSGTDLSSVADSINSSAGAFESTINSIGGWLGLGSSQTGTNQTAGN